LGQQVIVENRPGGNGFVAIMATVKAAPDGYTFVVGTVGEFAINPSLYKDIIPYDVERDLSPVAMLSVPRSCWRRAAPRRHCRRQDEAGGHSAASPGNGTFNHLAIEWFGLQAGIKLLHIPYRGGAPAATSVAAGDVPLGILAISSVAPFVQSGHIRVLAVTTARRSDYNRDWKTLQEEGVAEVDASNWVGLFAPKGVPQPIIEKLHREIQKILLMQDVRERFAAGGADTMPMGNADFDARVTKDTVRFSKIVADAGITAK
jgi:tripartite-type tricarboxylate transporter receptor subunit TctC